MKWRRRRKKTPLLFFWVNVHERVLSAVTFMAQTDGQSRSQCWDQLSDVKTHRLGVSEPEANRIQTLSGISSKGLKSASLCWQQTNIYSGKHTTRCLTVDYCGWVDLTNVLCTVKEADSKWYVITKLYILYNRSLLCWDFTKYAVFLLIREANMRLLCNKAMLRIFAYLYLYWLTTLYEGCCSKQRPQCQQKPEGI